MTVEYVSAPRRSQRGFIIKTESEDGGEIFLRERVKGEDMLIRARDKIILRSLTRRDAPVIFSVVDAQREYLREWLPWVDGTESVSDVENVIEDWQSEFESKTNIVLGIFDGGRYVGNMGLHKINRHNESSEIGYWLAKGMQGRGIMTDCVRALAGFGFNTLGLNRIYIRCAEGNKKSAAIPERLGFIKEGVMQDGECLHGKFQDMFLYGTVKRNWKYESPLCLVSPGPEHKEAALEFKREFIENGEDFIHGSSEFIRAEDYELWNKKIIEARTTAPEGFVPQTTYFAFCGERIVGTISVRHFLNDALLRDGGNIGYAVRPSERRKGYGAAMLLLALEKCRSLGLDKALVTCLASNTASAKTIKKNGGVLENEFTDDDGDLAQRYWIGL